MEAAVGHVEVPVGAEPREDVVVARDGDEAGAAGLALVDGFVDAGAADFGDAAVDDAGELVEEDERGVEEDGAGEVAPASMGPRR